MMMVRDPYSRVLNHRDPWLWVSILLGLALAFVAAYMAILRFRCLGNDNYDIAFYTRVVWGLAHGDRVNSIVGAHDLGLHFMPVMVLFAPLSYLVSIPHMLLVAQALALGGVVPLLYRAGVHVTHRPWVGLAMGLAWCLHPSVLHIGSTEFHPGSLALPALVASFTALHLKRDLEGVALLAVALMTREDVGLVVAGVGAILALEPGRRRLGAALAAGGLAWFLGYVLLVQPMFLPVRGSMEAHFAGLGHSGPEILASVFTRPGLVLSRITSCADLIYVPWLLMTLGGVCVLAPRWLVPAVPVVAVNLISSFPAAVDPTTHYVTLALPSIFFASVLALDRLQRWSLGGKRVMLLATLVVLLASLRAHVSQGATPLSLTFQRYPYVMDRDEGTLSWYARTIRAYPTVSVMAPAAVIGHLAERRRIYTWAFEHPKPDVAILDMTQRQWVQVQPARWDEPMEREMQRVDADPAYGTWRFNPPFRVAWRGVPGGKMRLARVSPGALPDTATVQDRGWDGYVTLRGLKSELVREREKFSGDYRSLFTVRTTFYWEAHRELPERLLLRVTIRGDTKTHVRWYLPTWGVRPTGSWKVGEMIRDEQWSTSPGGWPLSALSATVVFVDGDDRPYPPGARPIPLTW